MPGVGVILVTPQSHVEHLLCADVVLGSHCDMALASKELVIWGDM